MKSRVFTGRWYVQFCSLFRKVMGFKKIIMKHKVLSLNVLVTCSYRAESKTVTGADSRLSVRLYFTLIIAEGNNDVE